MVLQPSSPRKNPWVPRLSALVLVAAATLSGTAHAQSVSPGGKALVGGALLGSELVLFGEAIAGLERPWLYWAGAGGGAVGGAVGGYYIGQSASGRVASLTLVLGMALSIPALVVYLDATNAARQPLPSDYRGPQWQDEPAPLGSTRVAPLPPAMSALVESAVLGNDVEWSMAVPNVELDAVFSRDEIATWGAPSADRLLVTLLSSRF